MGSKKCINIGVTIRKEGLFYMQVPISLWPMLGKENRYFYTKHPNNNDPCGVC